jgi:hypothetical protein
MSSSVSHPDPIMHDFGDSPEDERLRGLTRQQLTDRLTWLSWWSPGTFQAVMDYMEFIDNLAADGDPGQDNPDDLAPYCLTCGSEIGIFTGSGELDWKHYVRREVAHVLSELADWRVGLVQIGGVVPG